MGRVQGVGFRYFVQSKAGDLALSGWVCNTPDGNVELEAQGSEENVSAFIADLRNGPGRGHVSDVRINELPISKNESGFDISY
jgi:acylphosphatase